MDESLKFDAVVIGAGVVGLAIANELCDVFGNVLVLDKEFVESNMWMSTMIEGGKIYLVRPDKYIYGSTSEVVSLSQLIGDLKTRIGLNKE